MKMVISVEEVSWLCRCILGQDVGSLEIAESIIDQGHSFESFRADLLRSEQARLNVEISAIRSPVAYRAERQDVGSESSIALAAIVKNGASTIERMIKSCLPIVNYVSIYDTGSDDDTLSICKSAIGAAPHSNQQGSFFF